MLSSTTLSPRGRLYVACVVAAGTLAIGWSLYNLYIAPVSYAWTVFALLTLFSGSFSIKVPSIPARISVSETFVFTAVLLFGTAPATLIVALDGLIISLSKKKRRLHRVLFNGAEPAISIWIASHLFFAMTGSGPLTQDAMEVGPLVVPLIVLTVVYFLLNSWMTAVAVWLETGISAIQLWRQHFLWLSLNYFGGASVAILLARNTSDFDYSALSLILPLLVISYLTFKTALQRVEDARAHVTQLNNLYLSTIETFAMWIDAKDQVTHGHIRRVQRYAVELARDLGVRDERLLKAIEAAALLHDMGKLAVPEHILNKPGKLTSGEFERMKLHASVGAEILSSIDFPYPVVPIVRHHHENWDGTGYPDHLAGTDIPIGARILAVVDCFDALTSDRPYRPRLPDEEAVAILLDRRGSMYDPLVVDAFMRVHVALAERLEAVISVGDSASKVGLALPPPQLDFAPSNLRNNGDAVLALCELARNLAGHAGMEDTAAVIVRHLTELVPASLCVLFTYQPDRDEIVALHASGTGAVDVVGMRLRLGVGISGWVAANRRSATDLDGRIELSKTGTASVALLNRAHSYPLAINDALVGVLTLYCETERPLPEGSLRTLELLVPHIARALQQARTFDEDQDSRLKDRLTGLPKFDSVAQLVTSPPSLNNGSHPLVVVFLDVDHLKSINQRYGTAIGDAVLRHVTDVIRAGLRAGDLLLRYAGDEFVVLLTESDLTTAECVAQRLVQTLSGSVFRLDDGRSLTVDLATAYAIAPADGNTLEQLVDVARTRALAPTAHRPSVVH